jgi:hypothetical protein
MLVSSTTPHRWHIICKRLKPEQQTAPLGLQYDRTKTLCRSATPPGLTANHAILDQRRDEPEMTL